MNHEQRHIYLYYSRSTPYNMFILQTVQKHDLPIKLVNYDKLSQSEKNRVPDDIQTIPAMIIYKQNGNIDTCCDGYKVMEFIQHYFRLNTSPVNPAQDNKRPQNEHGLKDSVLAGMSYQNKNELSYEQFHEAHGNKKTNDMLNSIVHANVYAKRRTQNRGYFSHPNTQLIENIKKLKDVDYKTGLPCSRDAHDNIITTKQHGKSNIK